MSTPSYDCLSCGACCFGGHDRYVRLLPEDAGRGLPDDAVTRIDEIRYMRMSDGHCAQLSCGDAGMVCRVYDQRPTACRAFRAGSFECQMSRKHRGAEAAGRRTLPLSAVVVGQAPAAMGAVPESAGTVSPGTVNTGTVDTAAVAQAAHIADESVTVALAPPHLA